MNLEEFRNYATEFNVIPVSRRLLADGNTPRIKRIHFCWSLPNMMEHGLDIHLSE